MTKDLYQTLIDAGVTCSNWQSDLYFPRNPQTTEILKQFPEIKASAFTSADTAESMYEVLFAYTPFWKVRGM